MKKNKWWQIVFAAIVVVVVVSIYLFFGLSGQDSQESESTEVPNVIDNEEVTEATQSQIEEFLNSTEIPANLVSRARELKTHIKENGYQEEDYYYLGYMFGPNLYCSIRYYEEMNILCLYNSYYTTGNSGHNIEVLAVMENFPYAESVKYYENYVVAEDGEEGSFILKAEAPITPETFTAESKLEFKTIEGSAVDGKEEDLTDVFKTAEKYSIMSFSFWDEMLELGFDVKLSDFRFKEFIRQDYKTINLE